MIKSWKNDASRKVWDQQKAVAFAGLDTAATINNLLALNIVRHTDDLAQLKSVGLRRKKGHGSKRWTMAVDDHWRVRFDLRKGDACDVKIVGGKAGKFKAKNSSSRQHSNSTSPAMHPGRLLKRELVVRELSASRLALDIGVPSGRITDILNARRAITADTAVRLGRYLGTSAQFWCDLQSQFDIAVVERKKGADIERRVSRATAVSARPSR